MSPASEPSAAPLFPERFDVLEELPARGGVRLVRARDTLLDREVLLKVVAEEAGASARTLREARALARIDHPAVHELLDVLETSWGLLLVLEPTVGETLEARLAREGRLPPDEVIALGLVLSEALEVVHGEGIVHRGIDAASILLTEDGRATLTGFHFAKAAQPDEPGAASSLVYRAPDPSRPGPTHPAPEQITKGQDGARADLFGLGWVLYRSLTGTPPYPSADPLTWSPPEDARALVPETPRALSRVLALCLSVSPSGRPADATALRRVLAKARGDAVKGVAATAATGAPRRGLWVGVSVLAGAALAYLLLGGPLPTSAAESSRGVAVVSSGSSGSSAQAPASVRYAPRYARSYALLIGVGEAYRDSGFPALVNAERDAVALAYALDQETAGPWEVQKLLGAEASREGIIDAVARLSDRAEPEDRVLIFFAGHGKAHERADGSGWLIPAGAKPGVAGRATWVRFDELFRFFHEARAKHILVAMDCCYGGRLLESRSADTRAYRERFLTRPAHVVLTSGRGDEQVSDGVAGEHSPFAKALVDGLAGSGPLTSTMLFASIQDAILRANVRQTPEFGYPDGSPVGGEFVFFRGE